MTGLTVVKLGGSFAGSPRLSTWLAAIAEAAGAVVLVPGGGPFADAVREAQGSMGYGDRAAHAMALLAMEQMAHALADRSPALKLAGSEAEIRRLAASGVVPVWTPAAMALAAHDVPASWAVTSDSLAAWLAGRLRAARLVLVKHVAPQENVSAGGLSARDVVDAAFPRMLERSGAEAWVAGPDAASSFGAFLAGGRPAGFVRILASAHAHA